MARSQIERQRLGYSLWVSRQFLFGLTSTLLANHPRVEVLKAPETLPLDSSLVWTGAAAYFEPRERGFWEAMRTYYPDAEYRVVTPPTGGDPMYYTGFVQQGPACRPPGTRRHVRRGRKRSSRTTRRCDKLNVAPRRRPH